MSRAHGINILLAIVALLGSACNDAGFQGGGSKKAAQQKEEPMVTNPKSKPKQKERHDTGKAQNRVVELPCSLEEQPLEISQSARTNDTVTVKAQFCLTRPRASHVRLLFLVDTSGSTRDSDPIVGGTCGRLEAVKAIAAAVSSQIADGTEAEAATIVFDDQAKVMLDFTPWAEFQSRINPAIFCEARGATNYEDAFKQSQGLIEGSVLGASVPVTAYLISDGLPQKGTETGQQAVQTRQAAATAAELLRTKENVNLNAVYLQLPGDDGDVDTKQYLAGITGDRERVRVVSDAKALRAVITDIELPPSTVTIDDVSAQLTSDGDKGKKSITMADVQADDTGRLIDAETEPFTLVGEKGKTVRNVVTLEFDAGDGTPHKASAVINFNLTQ